VENNCGTLVYYKPNGKVSESRFVSGKYKNSTWEFFDLGTKLAYKCQERGIKLIVRECGKSSGEDPPETPVPLAGTQGGKPSVVAANGKSKRKGAAAKTGR
jgi:hypothetical protein